MYIKGKGAEWFPSKRIYQCTSRVAASSCWKRREEKKERKKRLISEVKKGREKRAENVVNCEWK